MQSTLDHLHHVGTINLAKILVADEWRDVLFEEYSIRSVRGRRPVLDVVRPGSGQAGGVDLLLFGPSLGVLLGTGIKTALAQIMDLIIALPGSNESCSGGFQYGLVGCRWSRRC
jgi:hypothetical protein